MSFSNTLLAQTIHVHQETEAGRRKLTSRRVLRHKNLTPNHVSRTVTHKREAASQRLLCPSSSIARNQTPSQEQGNHKRHSHEITAPFRPLVLGPVGQQRHAQKPYKGWDRAERHEVKPKVLVASTCEADDDKIEDREDGPRNVEEDDFEGA